MKASHPDSKAISERIEALKEKWRQLEQYANDRRRQLEDAAEACSVRLVCGLLYECIYRFVYLREKSLVVLDLYVGKLTSVFKKVLFSVVLSKKGFTVYLFYYRSVTFTVIKCIDLLTIYVLHSNTL